MKREGPAGGSAPSTLRVPLPRRRGRFFETTLLSDTSPAQRGRGTAKRWRGRWGRALALAAAVFTIAAASDPAERLPDPAQEARAREIFKDVRCLVCQNESIDDSEADLAHDLRQIVREQVRAGKSEAEVKRFLTDRYGEFVLLTPSLNIGNVALWTGPFLVVLAGLGLLLLRLRNRTPDAELTPEEVARLSSLSADEIR